MLNLIARWKSMIEASMERVLEKAKKKKLIKSIHQAPKPQIELMKEVYKKNPEVLAAIELLEFFKRVENAEKMRESEFRKNVCLKILDRGEWITIDMDKLKEYSITLERFISQIKQILS